MTSLEAAISAARGSARWSVRGRLAARRVAELAARYDRRAIRLYAASLLLAEALANALRKAESPPPDGLAPRLAALALHAANLRDDPAATPPVGVAVPDVETGAPGWQAVATYLANVESLLALFHASARDTHGTAVTLPD
nr:hypothetical protein [Luteimonas sp. XNQY3]